MKPYSKEKREILAERSINNIDDFVTFFEEIKGTDASSLQKMVTPPKGFPKNKKLKSRTRHFLFKQFISRLKSENEVSDPNSVVWNQFGQIFSWWVKSQSDLFKILEDFKNEEDFDTGNKSIVEPNSDLDLKCFEVLLEASRKLQINQETIQRFYQYGYFVVDKQIEDLIDNSLTETEIEHKQRLDELPDKFTELFQTIVDLESRVSAVESANELKQELDKQIKGLNESVEENLQKLNQQITAVSESLNKKISKIKSSSIKMSELSKQVNPLKSQLSALKESVNTIENKLQTTDAPRIACQAVEIGKKAASLVKDEKKQRNEKSYLADFGNPLWINGITNPNDLSRVKAIHVALKTFSVMEITDPRIIESWKSACGNNLHVTTVDVGMGWLDSQDWFPKFFSEICFGEELRQMDLETSVEKMINTGNFLWAIHLSNCNRSYPECYLPRFLKWLGERKVYIKVFLTRCLGENCCNTSFEVYNIAGRLPKPTKMQSIRPVTLPVSEAIVDKSGWEHWCQLADEKLYQTEIQLLGELQLEIENIPLSLLQDIKSYLLLSHQIFDPDKALDWALYLRLYPWLAGRNEIEDKLFDFIKQSGLELRRTTDALQGNL